MLNTISKNLEANIVNRINNLILLTNQFFEEDSNSFYLNKMQLNTYLKLKDDFKIEKNLKIIRGEINLPLSVLGTTSSGKSTFVNGLLGCRISPMDADELTNCLIKFNFEDNMLNKACLSSKNLKQNLISTDSYENIYNEIIKVIEDNKSSLSYPELDISLSHLIGKERKIFKLNKASISEIRDLPGIKSINDQKNLNIIINNISGTFKVFIFDYSSIFQKENRKKLYELLNSIQNQYSENEILFVLNKIDLRNEDDKPLLHVLSLLKKEIKENLSLNFEPEIIPFNSLLFYYSQSIFNGYNSLKLLQWKKSKIKELIFSQLIHCLKDQSKIIFELKCENSDFKKLIINIEENLKIKGEIPNYKNYALFWEIILTKSGGEELIDKLNHIYSNSKILSQKKLESYLSEIYKLIYKIRTQNLYQAKIIYKLEILNNKYEELTKQINLKT